VSPKKKKYARCISHGNREEESRFGIDNGKRDRTIHVVDIGSNGRRYSRISPDVDRPVITWCRIGKKTCAY
jgi:hypothetical protein